MDLSEIWMDLSEFWMELSVSENPLKSTLHLNQPKIFKKRLI